MSDPRISQTVVPNDPGLKDVLDLFKKDILLSLNCHHIGTVQSFDSAKQTATATINYKKTFFRKKTDGTYAPELSDYPILLDCPVVVLGGGGGALTFPVAKGDECLVLFNDRAIDTWYQGSTTSPVPSPRLHSISDGLILVGVRSMSNAIDDYDTDGTVLRAGTTKSKITPEGKWVLTNEASGSTDLITALYNILTTATAGGFPLVVSAPDLTVLTSFKP